MTTEFSFIAVHMKKARYLTSLSAVLLAFWLIWISSTAAAQTARYETSVKPAPDEDLARDCRYELTLPNPTRPIRAVWVIFERGRELTTFYRDPEVIAFAQRQGIALMLAFNCPSKNYGDMNVNPGRGIGRAMFTALEQFARTTSHAELSANKVILTSFSAGGSLVARMAGYAPDRVIAAIPYAPGNIEPLGINTVELQAEALAIPQLIIANGSDNVCGTQRPYEYFQQYYKRGAPWTFVVQNNIPHCCIGNAKTLILTWLEAIIKLRQPTVEPKSLQPVSRRSGWSAFFKTELTATKDDWGQPTWNMIDVGTQALERIKSGRLMTAGWLPTRDVMNAWLSFVKATHSVISEP
jgi:dienelactone hydrolase